MKTLFRTLGLASFIAFAPTAALAQSQPTKLDRFFHKLDRSSRLERHWGGGILGGLSLITLVGAYSVESEAERTYFGIASGVAFGTALQLLLIPSPQERLAQQFFRLKEKQTSREILEAWSRVTLENFREDQRRARLVGGGTLAGVGALLVGTYLLRDENKRSSAMLYPGGVALGLGIVGLLFETRWEREAGIALDDPFSLSSSDELSWNWGLAPTNGGLAANIGFRF